MPRNTYTAVLSDNGSNITSLDSRLLALLFLVQGGLASSFPSFILTQLRPTSLDSQLGLVSNMASISIIFFLKVIIKATIASIHGREYLNLISEVAAAPGE
ncbi:uncharacterized protein H6S33_003644 [Morchella sextelata]|uniref:uncharacterized protein n=1 Tax=Morchella sextelata TaxID=1174677 RepID=UPI001D05A1B3|nr:uncharacterized protein H6S33_003644 [Morchella sextelata]KAH0606810.1 hypothetical protein H6S33_003644 [Morchella sextelata]